MKYLIIALAASLATIFAQAQDIQLPASNQSAMIDTAIEVANTFGPGYDVSNAATVEFSGPHSFVAEDERTEIQSCNGREYYTITFVPHNPQEYNFPYLAKVNIWADGTPQDVLFGNGWGRNFFFESYQQQKAEKNIEQVPLQKIRR